MTFISGPTLLHISFGHFHSWEHAQDAQYRRGSCIFLAPPSPSPPLLADWLLNVNCVCTVWLSSWRLEAGGLSLTGAMSAELFDWTKEELAETIKFAKFLKTNKFEVFEINWEQIAKGKNEQSTNENPKKKGKRTTEFCATTLLLCEEYTKVSPAPPLSLSISSSLSFLLVSLALFVRKFSKQLKSLQNKYAKKKVLQRLV